MPAQFKKVQRAPADLSWISPDRSVVIEVLGQQASGNESFVARRMAACRRLPSLKGEKPKLARLSAQSYTCSSTLSAGRFYYERGLVTPTANVVMICSYGQSGERTWGPAIDHIVGSFATA
jgi:hypothetical protein